MSVFVQFTKNDGKRILFNRSTIKRAEETPEGRKIWFQPDGPDVVSNVVVNDRWDKIISLLSGE